MVASPVKASPMLLYTGDLEMLSSLFTSLTLACMSQVSGGPVLEALMWGRALHVKFSSTRPASISVQTLLHTGLEVLCSPEP